MEVALTELLPSDNLCHISVKNVHMTLVQSGLLKSTSVSNYCDPTDSNFYEKNLTIQTDSRRCGVNSIFLAIPGSKSDGHLFIEDVLEKGTLVLIVETVPNALKARPEITYFEVTSSRQAWSLLCAAAFGNPQKSLQIIGVTGTNGKTSTVWLLRHLLDSHQSPCLSIGTLGAYFPDSYVTTTHTTPDPDQLFWLLALALKKGIQYVVMEVSSHSLVQKKVNGIEFSIGIFTSFSRDHLDYHKNMEEYFAAKCLLFSKHLRFDGTMIINQDISDQENLLPQDKKTIFYGNQKILSEKIRLNYPHSSHGYMSMDSQSLKGSRVSIALTYREDGDAPVKQFVSSTPFFAPHAVENLCASILAFQSLKNRFPKTAIVKNMIPIPGRLEPIQINNHGNNQANMPFCLVDYAHTPDALLKTIQIIKKINLGFLILVFGCGGDRDPGKRPLMGAIAAENCHKTFITSDNPRTEDPEEIIEQIRKGIPSHLSNKVAYELDRKIAIYKALEYCLTLNAPCTVLIAGKGHETYQIIGNIKTHFDDRIIAAQALNSLFL